MAPSSKASDVPKLLILPEGASQHARVLSLCNPRTLTSKRYLFCPEQGLYEFTRLTAPKTAPKSCLIAPILDKQSCQDALPLGGTDSVCESREPDHTHGTSPSPPVADGYIIESAEFLVATPIDPLFLVLPVLSPKPSSKKVQHPKQVFLSADDLLDSLCDMSEQFRHVVSHDPTRESVQRRIVAVCDSVAAGDETMYRLSNDKLLQELVGKARRMVGGAFPETLEARFVRKALEVPIMAVKREESSLSVDANLALKEECRDSQNVIQTPSEGTDSQTSITTSSTMESHASSLTSISIIPEIAPISAPEGIPELLRVRSALSYLLSSYVPLHLSTCLNQLLSSPCSPVDFTSLEKHLTTLSSLRTEALTSRSLSDFSRKRGMNDDDEAIESRAEKKRKKEEDEKRKKAGESRGVKDLKKVDTTGMKKLSDFFGKGAAGSKKKSK